MQLCCCSITQSSIFVCSYSDVQWLCKLPLDAKHVACDFWSERAETYSRWMASLCVFNRHNTGFRRQEIWKHKVWHWKGISEMMWLSRQPGGWWNTQVVYDSTLFLKILLFLYYPLPLFDPAGCSSLVCPTVFVMNTFRESPHCGTWWMRTVENALHSLLMLSPWPSLTTVYVYILHFNGFWKFPF